MEHRTKVFALKLYAKTKAGRKGYIDIPTISFAELGVVFQDKNIMDLRNIGICVLSSDKQGNPGVMMCENYADMNVAEFQNTLKRY